MKDGPDCRERGADGRQGMPNARRGEFRPGGALREMRLRKNQPSKPAPKEEASSEPKWFLSRGVVSSPGMKVTMEEGGQGATEIIAARGEWGAEPVQGWQEGSQPRDVGEEDTTEPGDTAGRGYSYSTQSARTGLQNKFRHLMEKKQHARRLHMLLPFSAVI